MQFERWIKTPHSTLQEISFLRALVFVAVAVGFYLNIYAVPLFDVDEGAFSEATREMFVRGDFISTYLNGVPRYDKPILIYWLQAISITLFGINEFAFRLPSVLAATLWVSVIYSFLKHLRNERKALLATIMMATIPAISLIGKAATADALLNFLLTSSMCLIYLFYTERKKKYLYLVYLTMALGFLTKGPIAVLIPMVVSGIFFGIKREFGVWWRSVSYLPGIALFIVIATPWYVAQYLNEGRAFIEGFFLHHNLDRFQGPLEGHAGSLLYYIPVIVFGVLPYTSVLLQSLSRPRSLFKDDLNLYAGVWFMFVFLFFSFSGTKLPHYIIYAFPALVILMTAGTWTIRTRLWWYLPALAGFLFLLLLPMIIDTALVYIKDPYVHTALADAGHYFPPVYWIMLIFSLGFVTLCLFYRRINITYGLLICGVLTVGSLSGLATVAGQIIQQPVKDAALYVKKHDLDVVMWRLTAPSFNVYSERLVRKGRPARGDIVLTKSIYVPQLSHSHILFQKNAIALVRLE